MYRQIAIVILILMYINLNESKPFMSVPTLRDKVDSLVDRTSKIDVSASDEQKEMDVERDRRNCFFYGRRASGSKWMCW